MSLDTSFTKQTHLLFQAHISLAAIFKWTPTQSKKFEIWNVHYEFEEYVLGIKVSIVSYKLGKIKCICLN